MLLLSAPLHCLRKTKAFQTLLNSQFNRPALYQLGYDHRVAIRPLTHCLHHLEKGENTNNLFACHPEGPIKKESLKNIIHI